jgi:hypothetical protein
MSANSKLALIGALLLGLSAPSQAVEITPFVEYVLTDDLILDGTEQSVSVDDTTAVGLIIGWDKGVLGQGQLSLSYGSYDFKTTVDDELIDSSFDLLYAHFNGVAHYRQQNYTTTVSFGLGATFIDSDNDSSSYPSITAGLGTRYNISQNLALITELRAYGTFADDDSSLFCRSGANGSSCFAQFDGSFWVDAALRLGIAYRF